MNILLVDDNGFSHPVLKNVSHHDIPELIDQAHETCADLGRRFGYTPPPIEAMSAGRFVAV
jgi:hypothetical protein